ncbi:MAG: LptA/OstA family protein [Kiritimatiellia bacterium]
MKKATRFRLAAGALVLLCAMEVNAETNVTVVTSDSMDFDYSRRIAEFRGNVVVVSPSSRLESDGLNVIFTEEQKVRSVSAVGNVELTRGEISARCERAIYSGEKGRVLLMGRARVRRPGDELSADEIELGMQGGELEVVKAEGNARLTYSSGEAGFSLDEM